MTVSLKMRVPNLALWALLGGAGKGVRGEDPSPAHPDWRVPELVRQLHAKDAFREAGEVLHVGGRG